MVWCFVCITPELAQEGVGLIGETRQRERCIVCSIHIYTSIGGRLRQLCASKRGGEGEGKGRAAAITASEGERGERERGRTEERSGGGRAVWALRTAWRGRGPPPFALRRSELVRRCGSDQTERMTKDCLKEEEARETRRFWRLRQDKKTERRRGDGRWTVSFCPFACCLGGGPGRATGGAGQRDGDAPPFGLRV